MKNNKEYTDEHEKKTHELINKLTKNNFKKNVVILKEAANEIIKSANPEAQAMYNFMYVMSKQQEAKSEKDPRKAIEHCDNALEYLSKCSHDDMMSNEYIETKIIKLNMELKSEMNKKNFNRATELFLEIATEENKRGHEKSYHMNMGCYHLYNGKKYLPHNPAKALREIDLSAQSFEKISNTNFQSKILGIKYRLLASFQPTYEARLSFLNKALKEIEKTDDKFGINELKGSICYVSAQSERDWQKKTKLFREAAKYYKKDGLFNNYHEAIGWATFWETHNPLADLEKSIFLIKDSQKHFKKSDNARGLHNSTGFLFLLKAIKEGIIQDRKGKFAENIKKANYHFARSQHFRYVNFTAGIGLILEAAKLPHEKSKYVFKKAAEILQSIDENLYHLAYYQYYRIEANENIDKDSYRTECLTKAATHIEAWLEVLRDRPKLKTDILVLPDFDSVISFIRAQAFHLRGMIETDPSKQKHLFRLATEEYDVIIDANYLPARAWHAKGWTLMFLFEFDKAHDAFLTAYQLDPGEQNIKDDIDFANDYLKRGFRDLKHLLEEEARFSRKLQNILLEIIGQSRQLPMLGHENYPGQSFYQEGIISLQKAGRAMEENYPAHMEKDEEGLRDEMLQCLKMLYSNVSAESKKAKGKTDIFIKDISGDKELIAECLVWKGIQYYYSKKDQLFDRYLTWHNKEAALITFVRNKDFVDILSTAATEIRKLTDIVEASFQDLSDESYKLYITENKHKSGVTIRLHHLFFHLPLNGEEERTLPLN